jgi:hypothetical protein
MDDIPAVFLCWKAYSVLGIGLEQLKFAISELPDCYFFLREPEKMSLFISPV